jgi:flagellar hook-basal body complex protein FliE
MAMADKIPSDKSPDRISPGKPLEPADRLNPTPSTTSFESYMKGTSGPTPQGAAPAGTPPGVQSPMEAAKGPSISGTPTFDTLAFQARNAQDSLGNIGQQLNTPNLKLKRAQSHLLRNKLQDANSYIRSAGAKVGVEAPPMKPSTGASPIDRFIAYVNDGQDQLQAVQQKLKEMAASGEEIRPGDMMLIQVKMNLAQQEIEYSSTLLGKVIDSLKQIMNIQL